MRGAASEKGRKCRKAARIFGDNLQNSHKKIDDFFVSVYYGKRWSGFAAVNDFKKWMKAYMD